MANSTGRLLSVVLPKQPGQANKRIEIKAEKAVEENKENKETKAEKEAGATS